MVLPDLQRTTAKGQWWLGRKLRLRIHLGACLLQWLYNLTDRQVDWAIKDNAAYQLFCGRETAKIWGDFQTHNLPTTSRTGESP
jgi:hypothetical protein